jgi:microcompartment protein CcmK/EutM
MWQRFEPLRRRSRCCAAGSNRGDPVIALDAVDAGVGDRVLLVTEGFGAMTSVDRPQSPIDMAVVGVIDQRDLGGGGAIAPSPAGQQDRSNSE